MSQYNIIKCLSIYLFIFYFFIRILYTYYGVELGINIWVYRIGFYIPMLFWCILILKNYYDYFLYYKKNKFFYFFIFLFFYISIKIIYNKFFGLDYITDDVVNFQVKILFYSVFNILIGAHIYHQLYVEKSKKIFLIVWILYSIVLLINLKGLTLDNHGISSLHLLVGDTFVVISIIGIFTNISNKYLKIFLFTLVLFLVYTIKSRASFYSIFVVYIFFILKEIGIKNFLYLILLMFVGLTIMYKFDFITIDKRMFGVLEGKSDGSLNERLLQFQYGIEAIKENWFFGEFAGQVIIHDTGYKSGSMGCYMHNWLSYWRQYGLVFFTFFTSMYLYAFYIIFKKWTFANNKIVNTIFYLALFVGVELLLFRSYANTLVWFVFILMYMYIYNVKKEKLAKSNINCIK